MAIGRAEDRESPGNPTMLRHREYVRDPIRVTHLGQRSIRPHTQAGHMTAIDQTHRSCKTPCQAGAVHTWVPGMTMALNLARMGDHRDPALPWMPASTGMTI